ncbi:DoxX-like protein [Yoonia maricola]|uniref:DoxX-like protein n=1 Tax=Yoonia maricola TaxID=420999 RepID=A0A2M8W4Y0_9RHOB|nr:DoxX family protein [Yoonia maricola]PJI85985.1 DoxX-like protein [Yoonia maricola]
MNKSASDFDPSTANPQTSPWPNRLTWGVQISLALAFGAAGGSKLIGVTPMVDLFDLIGLGQWFRYVTGAIEVGSAVLLLNVRSSWIGASLLICTMFGAVIVHIVVVPSPPIGPLVLGTLSAIVLFRRRPRAF